MSSSPVRHGMWNLVTTTLRWAAAGSVFVIAASSLLLCAPFMRARTAFPFMKRALRLMIRLAGLRVRVRGLEHVKPGTGYVYMLNHSSFLDHFVVAAWTPDFLVGLEKASNFRLPLYGWLVRWWGNIPVVRDDKEQARAAVAEAQRIFESGTSIGLAPEGTRTEDGCLGPFKKGGFHLARNTGAWIVPVSLVGMHERNPDRAFRLVAGPVDLVFHPPLPSSEGTLEELIARVRTTMASAGIPLRESAPAR